MKIYPVISNYNVYHSQTHKSSRRSLTFKGTPIYLDLSQNNIENYNRLSNGSYLDIHDDLFSPSNKTIRAHNLSFLDKIVTEDEKKKFIDYYKSVTKFPSLADVSENIEKEYVRSINVVANGFSDPNYSIVAAGYDEMCSVGKKYALPGSDLDKAFIILRGDISGKYNPRKDFEIVNNFRNRLWFATDQRILSYNHDTSFPTIMTINQIKDYISRIDKITNGMIFDPVRLRRNIEEEYMDLMKASEFNIHLSKRLPKRKYDDAYNALNKENIKNFGYFIEAMREGKILVDTPYFRDLTEQIKNSEFYQFSNAAQMRATKNAVNSGREYKTKILLRMDMAREFNSWDINKQFEFIKTMIKYSCEDQDNFLEYFANDRNFRETYKPLLGVLCYGDKSRRLNPEFDIRPNRIDIYLTKNRPTHLYQGFAPHVLWIESKSSKIIEDVLLHVDKLRKTQLFKNIRLVQAPMPKWWDSLPDKFKILDAYTKGGRRIIERSLR